MNTQDWSPLGWTGWLSSQSKGLSRVFSNTTVQKVSDIYLVFFCLFIPFEIFHRHFNIAKTDLSHPSHQTCSTASISYLCENTVIWTWKLGGLHFTSFTVDIQVLELSFTKRDTEQPEDFSQYQWDKERVTFFSKHSYPCGIAHEISFWLKFCRKAWDLTLPLSNLCFLLGVPFYFYFLPLCSPWDTLISHDPRQILSVLIPVFLWNFV